MHIFLTAPQVCRPESKMIFGKVFLAAIKRILRNTGNPNQVEDAMKHIMKATNTVVHSWYVIDLLKTLKRKGLERTRWKR